MTMTLHSLVGALVVRSRLKTNGEKPRREEHNRTSRGAIYTHTHILLSSFLNRKPCRRVFVLALVLVVVPLSGDVLPAQTRVRSTDVVVVIAFKKVVLEEQQQRVGQQQRARERRKRRLGSWKRKPEQQRGGRTWSTMTT